MNTTEKELQYLAFLKEVYEICQVTDKFAITKVMNKNRITANGRHTFVLFDSGILKRDAKGSRSRYEWNTIKPNLQMAQKYMKEVKRANKRYNDEYAKRKKEEEKANPNLFTQNEKQTSQKETVSVVQPTSQHKKKISIFWGLYKYETE